MSTRAGMRRKNTMGFIKPSENGLKRRRKSFASSDHRADGCTSGDDENHFDQSSKKRSHHNMTALLYRREIGTLRDQFHLCRAKLGSDDYFPSKTNWYLFARRLVPFSKLETPLTDAVLALDRSGSYLISLGDGRDRVHADSTRMCTLPSLAIRFYGMPSPSFLIKRKKAFVQCHRSVSTHVSTIPLLFEASSDDDYASDINNAATIPIQILFSSDGELGVSFLHHVKQDEDDSCSVTIFPLPHNDCARFEKIYTIKNANIGGLHAHSPRNLLWKTKLIPMMESQRNIIKEDFIATDSFATLQRYITLKSRNGHVLFYDEEDGFRIFWISSNLQVVGASIAHPEFPTQKIIPKMNDIVTPCYQSESVTDSGWVDTISGSKLGQPPRDRSHAKVNVTFEAYLHVEVLLREILLRRKSLVTSKESPCIRRIPDYYYSLVSFGDHDDRSVCIVIVFANPMFSKMMIGNIVREKKVPAAAYGLYVTLDLFDQSYSEGNWVSHPSNNESRFLRQWANKLAVSRRMADMRVGPYCAHVEKRSHRKYNAVTFHEHNVDDKLDKSSHVWSSFVTENGENGKKFSQPPKAVAMSSLYPFCDVITNDDVTSATPKKTIECRDFPLALTYCNTDDRENG